MAITRSHTEKQNSNMLHEKTHTKQPHKRKRDGEKKTVDIDDDHDDVALKPDEVVTKESTGTPRVKSVVNKHEGDSKVTRRVQNPHFNPTTTKWTNYQFVIHVAVVIAIVIAISFGISVWYMNKQLPERKSGSYLDLKNLVKEFPSQEQHIWDTINATVSSYLAKDVPDRPIVLLFASHQIASTTTDCFSQKLGSFLSTVLESNAMLEIKGESYQNNNDDDAKLSMDNKLQDFFQKEGKTVIVYNLDKLPPCSILLFHNYCENENACFKNAAVIFTVSIEDNAVSGSVKSGEDLISDHLTKVWTGKCSKLTKDKVEAMLSRVANNAVIIQKENRIPC